MKKWIIVVSLLIAAVLIIPFPVKIKDGGTVEYKAVLYTVYDVHKINPADIPNEDGTHDNEFIEGIVVKIFGTEVFNSTDPHIDM